MPADNELKLLAAAICAGTCGHAIVAHAFAAKDWHRVIGITAIGIMFGQTLSRIMIAR